MNEAPAEHRILDIEIFAERFDWTARYPGEDNKLGAFNYRYISATNKLGLDTSDPAAMDDVIIEKEVHLPEHSQIRFHFRSKDVIHSAYLPQMRMQMNVVPGMNTEIRFETGHSTDSLRVIYKDPAYKMYLLCNKICGTGHYQMQEKIIIDNKQDFFHWYTNAMRNRKKL